MFWFGKYKGKKLSDVVQESPSYVHWCLCTIVSFRLKVREEALELYALMRRAEKALQYEEEAWAYTGGRLPTFDEVFWKLSRQVRKEQHGKRNKVLC